MMRLVKASLLTIVIAFIISLSLTWSALHSWTVPLIASLFPCGIGIAVGASGCYVARQLIGRSFFARLMCAVGCGVIAGVIDLMVLIGQVDAKPGNAAIYAAEIIGVAYTVLMAGIVGIVFGAGAGQKRVMGDG